MNNQECKTMVLRAYDQTLQEETLTLISQFWQSHSQYLPDLQETYFLRAFVMNKRSAARRLTGPCNGVVFQETICLSQQFAFFYNGGGFFG